MKVRLTQLARETSMDPETLLKHLPTEALSRGGPHPNSPWLVDLTLLHTHKAISLVNQRIDQLEETINQLKQEKQLT